MNEVGIYRVSGSASDLQKLKKSFESSEFFFNLESYWNDGIMLYLFNALFTDAYEAEQLLKEVDIHSVTGNLKSYLRELPEALFTDLYYQKVILITNLNETHSILINLYSFLLVL